MLSLFCAYEIESNLSTKCLLLQKDEKPLPLSGKSLGFLNKDSFL